MAGVSYAPDFSHLISARVREANAALRFAVRTSDVRFVEDDVDPSNIDGLSMPPIRFRMLYESVEGRSDRVVRLLKFAPRPSDKLIYAWCYMADGFRCFRQSRILEISSVDTGEVFDDVESYFSENGTWAEGSSPEARALYLCMDDLVVLSFLAAADGTYHPKEIDEIVKHVCRRFPEPLDETRIRRRILSVTPDETAFFKALNRVRHDFDNRHQLIRAIRCVMDADGSAHHHEQELGHLILAEIVRSAEAAEKRNL